MDRLSRALAGCGLVLLLASAGCRSARSGVPPGRAYSNDGRQAPAVGFSSDPHPANSMNTPAMGGGLPGSAGGLPTSPGGLPSQFGTPSPSTGQLGTPTTGLYGGPGTSGSAAGLGASPSAGSSAIGGGSTSFPGPSMSGGSANPLASPPMGTQPPGLGVGGGSQP